VDQEILKERAARAAVSRVESGMRLGLGTGSTMRHVLVHLASRLRRGELWDIAGVPTSEVTSALARELGIPLLELHEVAELDLAIDGADEVDPRLDLIKGLGGALLRERMVAAAARRFLVVADASKCVERLGTKSPLPVEVVEFAWRTQERWLATIGAEPRIRTGPGGVLFRTDNQALVLDCRFREGIADPRALASRLEARPGVIAHGLFLGLCTEAILAAPERLEFRRRS
jgi:ribose 5-phosphate isomerase A